MRSLATFLTVSVLALAYPATAGALIQIDRGIAGARLNNTKAQVRAALGRPGRVIHGNNDFGSFTTFRYRGAISVTFQGDRRVSSVTAKGPGDRTARGVGVGSTEQQVEQRVAGISCETFFGTRSCHTGTFAAGTRVTDFRIRNGRVTRVTVAFVID
jgi:hypothetical protein